MLEYNKIDFSEWIDVNENDVLRECIVYHYRYFLNSYFKLPEVRNDWHNLTQETLSFDNVTIVSVKKMIIEFNLYIWVMKNP